ncbi:hypothetical protein [Allomuricauda sp. SCSIO 65647]|uniref:hypothetical protein n=1 Tax=Allomuricauda sp. SCSIO 65647 TaxID=2908843 RepID=UPI001F4770AB|nr:hypothetical protein [Muricauda sp. SCSIO 65647]UJH69142.1 hypothetical protein L0P89_07985 [Muricauda sp. SCSIO 65647]
MMSRHRYFLMLPLLCSLQVLTAQTNNLTGSPYSLFGLGVNSNSNVGINSALGRGGYALSGASLINNLNPASYGDLGDKTFIYDFGFLAELSAISNRSSTENRLAGSFSNIAIAANLDAKSAFGLSIVPFSDVGYSLIGIESNIEGSLENFTANVFGSGALNDLRLSYGYGATDYLRFGFYASYLFGSIDERELVSGPGFANETGLNIEETNYYNGLRFGLGLQIEPVSDLVLAWGVDLPTILSGSQDRRIQRTLDFAPSVVEDEQGLDIDDFKLPMKINTGLLWQPTEGLGISMDYSLALWNATEQKDNVGEYIDEEEYAIGLQYVQDENSYLFSKRIQYRAGFNYNTGYLAINDNPIDSYTITAGLGIPLGNRTLSSLNISYGFTARGATEGILVEEQIHTLNVNLSLKDFWFLKRKIE